MQSEYYTREKGYVFYILEEDGETVREATDVEEWRAKRTSWKGLHSEAKGWRICTWFYGCKNPHSTSLWVTSVGPVGVCSPQADIMDLNWNTYKEAVAGHGEVVRKIEEDLYPHLITEQKRVRDALSKHKADCQ